MTMDVADAIFAQHGVPKASEMEKGELKSLWRQLSVKNHPDKGGNEEDMRFINAAYDVLKDTIRTTGDDYDDLVTKFNPKDVYSGRTMPKTKYGKAALEVVNIEFRFEDNDAVIATGRFDAYDILTIIRELQKLGATVSYDPLIPMDQKTGQWLMQDVIVYVNTVKMPQAHKREIQKTVVKLAAKFHTKGKSA